MLERELGGGREEDKVVLPSLFWKMFEETTPMRLARGTPNDVRTTRRPSCAMLLLYQTSSSTEGADVPLESISFGSRFRVCKLRKSIKV